MYFYQHLFLKTSLVFVGLTKLYFVCKITQHQLSLKLLFYWNKVYNWINDKSKKIVLSDITLRWDLRPLFWLGHQTNILVTPFVLCFYELQIEVLHDKLLHWLILIKNTVHIFIQAVFIVTTSVSHSWGHIRFLIFGTMIFASMVWTISS